MSFGLNEHRSPHNVGFGYALNGTPEPPVIIIPDNPAPTPGDKLPQTGLLQWPITLLAAIGVLLVAVGCRLRRRRKPT